jgi:carbonic anhydrase/acetyltransferase-like protein (isoleucine patch superfamily)
MVKSALLVMPYDGVSPQFKTPPVHEGPGSAVLGRATLGKAASLGALSVIRADGHYVAIGDDFWLGANGTVHIAHAIYPTNIGDHVTAGVNAVVHACDVGSNCFIGRDVIVLDGSKVAADVAIADGSIVFPRSTLDSGFLYEGQPAKPVRRLRSGELDAMHAAARAEPDQAASDVKAAARVDAAGHLFVARTARLQGHLSFGKEVGIWFGCKLDAGAHEIVVGDDTNIQDNTTIHCIDRGVSIGCETTIGHNVSITDCTIGNRSLIGIGAVVSPGTIVEEDVLLAAGARTSPNQILAGGWLYGGSPARQLSSLNEAKRKIITSIWPTYEIYARDFEKIQQNLALEKDAVI